MRWTDAIEHTQHLHRVCRIPGLLPHIWGSIGSQYAAPGDSTPRPINVHDNSNQDATRVDSYARSLGDLFTMAEPYYVTARLLDVIEAASLAIPAHTRLTADMFPSRYGCLFFDRPVNNMPDRRLHHDLPHLPRHEPAPMSGFAWQATPDGTGVSLIMLCSWAVDRSTPSYFKGVYVGNIPLAVTPWEYASSTLGDIITKHTRHLSDQEVADNNNNQRFAMMMRHTAATLLLMQQTITTYTSTPLDRHARKRALRSGWRHAPEVRVVTLRRVEANHADHDTPNPIDWQCRWWTRAHWRTLHRGTPQERTTFVTAHLKGPEAMPIKLPGYRVFAVTR